jgi:hypothetical protein
MATNNSSDRLWQKKLLPFMIFVLTALTIFFIITSYIEFREFKNRIDRTSQNDGELLKVMNISEGSLNTDEAIMSKNTQSGTEYVKWRTRVLLERESLNRRYNHSLSIIFSRVWTRYLGFLTGMILAMVGATFILGKLSEEMSELGGETSAIKFTLKTASPGIILAVLGTALLVTTLVVQSDVNVDDGNLYLGAQSDTSDQLPPKDINFGDATLPDDKESPAPVDGDVDKRKKEVERQLREIEKLKQQDSKR